MHMQSPQRPSVLSAGDRVDFNLDWRFHADDPAGTADLTLERVTERLVPFGAALDGPIVTPGPLPARVESEPLGQDIAYTQPSFDDGEWRRLDLPHDWAVEGGFDPQIGGECGKLRYFGIGWYRKRFMLSPEDLRDGRLFLEVDGAMSHAAVWINGRFVGGWPYGYTSWRVELSPHAVAGENLIAIRVQNPPDSSRWYPGAGLYRNVWLAKSPAPLRLAHWGVGVTTPRVTGESAAIALDALVENDGDAPARVTVRTRIHALGSDESPTGAALTEASAALTVMPRSRDMARLELTLDRPALWELDRPALHVAVTTLESPNGALIERRLTPFGIRAIEFRAAEGFFLNGRRVQLNGVCNHHDLGALGSAINFRAMQRQLEIMKEMGCNAIRTSHNPPAPELLDLCDRMGMLAIVEAFDCWEKRKRVNDYSRLFPTWHGRDLRAMVRRDRNHPSVIMWSTGNEIHEQSGGHHWSQRLRIIAHEEDRTRPVTVGCNNADAADNGFQRTLDVFGFNYKPHLYEKLRCENPDLPMYGSETASTVSTRGFYVPDDLGNRELDKRDFQVSSYDLHMPPWATTPDREFAAQDDHPYVMGEFVWTGFDYLGEPTPFNFDPTLLLNAMNNPEALAKIQEQLRRLGNGQPPPSRSSYFGIVDLCGFKKDRFYLYQSHWRPELPMAHLLPHWTWSGREGRIVPVMVYTSGDEAELFVNGRSLGRKRKGPREYRLRWDETVYQPGELKVAAYKNGKPWATDVKHTAGPATTIRLSADRAAIAADGRDLAFITAEVLDRAGELVPDADPTLRFNIDNGPGEIVTTDNGDPTSLAAFHSPVRKAFHGLALAIVRSRRGAAGAIQLSACGDGLQSASVSIDAVNADL